MGTIAILILVLAATGILTNHIFRNRKEKKAEIEYQLFIEAEISENEELKKIVEENEKWDKIAELG